jgi:hypothetical protein
MQFQGHRVAQVCPMSGDRGEVPRETSCMVNSGKSRHLLSMVIIGREKRLRLGYWK